MIHVCFVCLGNICRSPTAEGVMIHLLERENLRDEISVDSAGTSSWHIGDPPDERSQATAEERGFPLTSRSSQFHSRDFARFDYVIAMDNRNRQSLERMAPDDETRSKIHLLRSFDADSDPDDDVPDPYYGGPGGFDQVLDICIAGCEGFLAHLQDKYSLG